MTMGLMAQCPQKQEGCQTQCKQTCEKKCVYSPETRAMMHLDRISQVVTNLTTEERTKLLDFFKKHYTECEARKFTANPMTKEECRKVCAAELRKVIGDDRYIQYLESTRTARVDKKCCKKQQGKHGECPKVCRRK